jgi:hypothetical protein
MPGGFGWSQRHHAPASGRAAGSSCRVLRPPCPTQGPTDRGRARECSGGQPHPTVGGRRHPPDRAGARPAVRGRRVTGRGAGEHVADGSGGLETRLARWLEADFDLRVVEAGVVDGGVDRAARLWRVRDVTGRDLAVRWAAGGTGAGPAVARELADAGVEGIVAPLPARSGPPARLRGACARAPSWAGAQFPAPPGPHQPVAAGSAAASWAGAQVRSRAPAIATRSAGPRADGNAV